MSVERGPHQPGEDGGQLPGSAGTPPPSAAASRLIGGRYRLVVVIGQGSMGRVWHARDELLGRDVALKAFLFPRGFTQAEKAELQQRLLREARSAARLSHPAVATVFDVIDDLGHPWIVMELVRGRSLDRILAESGPLPPDGVARIGQDLLAALAAAHAVGVVHRDVKPSNVMLTSDGGAVLTDFGVATIDGDPSLTRGGMVMGTPAYSAPERIRGQAATPATDLWSVGVTLYAALEGQGPYDDYNSIASTIAAIATEDPAPLRDAGPITPAVMALLNRDPAARPTAAEAMRMLAEAVTSQGTPWAATASDPHAPSDPPQAEDSSEPPEPPDLPPEDIGGPEEPERKPRHVRRAALAVAACLVIALGISLWVLNRSAPVTSARQTSQSVQDIQSSSPTAKPVKVLRRRPKPRKQPPLTRSTPAQQPAGGGVPTVQPSSASPRRTSGGGNPAPSPSPPAIPSCGVLLAGQVMHTEGVVYSCNDEYTLNMQGDGNLVLRNSSAAAVWDTGTQDTGADEAVMESDGNFELLTSSGSVVWDSGTSGNDGAYLDVGNTGDLDIYATSGAELWDNAVDAG
jgi:eukaryotic-like serine/threonine-protein kinase